MILRCLKFILTRIMFTNNLTRIIRLLLTAPCLPCCITDGPARGGTLSLKGPNAVFVPKPLESLGSDTGGYASHWNTQHINMLQFSYSKSKDARGKEVNKRWSLMQAPLIAQRKITQRQGFKDQVRAL